MTLWKSLSKEESIPENRQGYGQNYFRYYTTDGRFQALVAVNGRLLKDGGDIPIQGMDEPFQTERPIEAVQYGEHMFIATGTKLVEYDGVIAKVVEPFKPSPLDALYIGKNGLAEDPDNYMEDGVASILRADGIVPSMRYGIVNKEVTFTGYVSKPEDELQVVEYKWEYKLTRLETLVLGQDWSTENTWTHKFPDSGDWYIQLSVRVKGSADVPSVTTIPKYRVSDYDQNRPIDTSNIHTCNRILLHHNRIILYGDTKDRNRAYISHLRNPRYFPQNNTIEFESNEQEGITKIIRYRGFLVAFLPSEIQALYGTAPDGDESYQRVTLHTGLGCIAPETPKVLGNDIAFLSNNGIYRLKQFGMSESKMNVEKIDHQIANLVVKDPEACAIVFQDQYQIIFPRQKLRFRFYRHLGVWTKDQSPMLDISRMYEWNGEMVTQDRLKGTVAVFDPSIRSDLDYEYDSYVQSKNYDFEEPHAPKKLKQVQLILSQDAINGNSYLEVFGDESKIVEYKPLLKEQGNSIEINEETNIVKVPLQPRNKIRTASLKIGHNRDEPFTILGFGFQFKLKKP